MAIPQGLNITEEEGEEDNAETLRAQRSAKKKENRKNQHREHRDRNTEVTEKSDTFRWGRIGTTCDERGLVAMIPRLRRPTLRRSGGKEKVGLLRSE
jgi:hypothetical protein